MFKRVPSRPSGSVFGSDFVSSGDVTGLKVAIITRVDHINMKADLRVITGGGDRFEIDLTQGMCGPRSFWGGVPEVHSVVIVGYRRIHKQLQEAVILGYIPTGNKSGLRFDPFSTVDPSEVSEEDRAAVADIAGGTIRYKRLVLMPGDVGGMSASGAEMVLSKDVALCNRAGDSLELRDDERALVIQSIHKFESQSGLRKVSGPIRRSAFFLPDDIFSDVEGKVLRSQLSDSTAADTYFGRDELQAAGPGEKSSPLKFSNSAGVVSDRFNDFTNFKPVVLSNGRRVHYPPTLPGGNIEVAKDASSAFVEDRLELFHTSDLTQEVLEEIDGFAADRRTVYIERVIGTVVGNDMNTNNGQRQYAKILKPRLFQDFKSQTQGSFSLNECDRNPTKPDTEVLTSAAAFLFRIRPPRSTGTQNFVAAVTKQGKLVMNIPASTVEDQQANKISAELNLEGALKAYIGASNPDRISAHITLEGGLHLNIGRDAKGNVITNNYQGAVKSVYSGTPNEDDVAYSEEVNGVKELAVTGAVRETIQGRQDSYISGQWSVRADNATINTINGFSLNCGELNLMTSGKSQLQYAQALVSTIVTGGEVKTIMAGGLATNVAAGAISFTASAGATSFSNPSGGFSVTVGTGALGLTTASGAVTLSTGSGALAITAGGGAIAITAGAALTMTAAANAIIIAPLIVLGGPSAILGVVRGTPTYPPGVPTLDTITGSPLLGAATVLSN